MWAKTSDHVGCRTCRGESIFLELLVPRGAAARPSDPPITISLPTLLFDYLCRN